METPFSINPTKTSSIGLCYKKLFLDLALLSTYLRKLDERGILYMADEYTSGQLLLGMLKGDKHFRCLLGLQLGLSETEKERIVDAAVSLFLKGHRYEA